MTTKKVFLSVFLSLFLTFSITSQAHAFWWVVGKVAKKVVASGAKRNAGKRLGSIRAKGVGIVPSLSGKKVGEKANSFFKNFRKSPKIKPTTFANKTPKQVHKLAISKGLVPQKATHFGNRKYLDPITKSKSKPRLEVHPYPRNYNRHIHINDVNHNRIGINGKKINNNLPGAHLPLKYGDPIKKRDLPKR